jgi:hypothetical protein
VKLEKVREKADEHKTRVHELEKGYLKIYE